MIRALTFLGLFVLGCAAEPKFELDRNTEQQFEKLPGTIGVTVKNHSNAWYYTLYRGKLQRVNSLPKPPAEAASVLKETLRFPDQLPKPQSYVYWGPYLQSPDGVYFAVSIAPVRDTAGGRGLVIIERFTQQVNLVLNDTRQRYIDALAWSPDSRFIAILRSSYRTGYGPGDLIALASGHGVPYMTYYLEVTDLNGTVVAQTKLASEVRGSWAWIVWINRN